LPPAKRVAAFHRQRGTAELAAHQGNPEDYEALIRLAFRTWTNTARIFDFPFRAF
jgi:hypothetical protein